MALPYVRRAPSAWQQGHLVGTGLMHSSLQKPSKFFHDHRLNQNRVLRLATAFLDAKMRCIIVAGYRTLFDIARLFYLWYRYEPYHGT